MKTNKRRGGTVYAQKKAEANGTIVFNEIQYNNHTLKLRRPLSIDWILSESVYSMHYAPLGMFIYAPTMSECKEEFQEEFTSWYLVYAKEKDVNLTTGAKKLKDMLLNLVEADMEDGQP